MFRLALFAKCLPRVFGVPSMTHQSSDHPVQLTPKDEPLAARIVELESKLRQARFIAGAWAIAVALLLGFVFVGMPWKSREATREAGNEKLPDSDLERPNKEKQLLSRSADDTESPRNGLEQSRRVVHQSSDPSDESQTENDSFDARLSDQADEKAAEVRSRITTELDTLHSHPWAGSYYKGDGLGVNVSLLLAPTSGYLFEWHGCTGLYDRNYGSVESRNEELRLSFTFPNIREGFQDIAPEFLRVHWGNREYLIPSDDIIGFCNDVNSGTEPRNFVHGRHLLREGDEKKHVEGFPTLPPKFKPYLLARPVDAEIIGIGTSTTRPSITREWSFKDTKIVLNVGNGDRVLPGMEFYVIEPEDVVESLLVKSVEDGKSIAMLTQMDDDAVKVEVGWKLSTRPRWYEK